MLQVGRAGDIVAIGGLKDVITGVPRQELPCPPSQAMWRKLCTLSGLPGGWGTDQNWGSATCNLHSMAVSSWHHASCLCWCARSGETLCDEKAPIILERMDFPDPVIKIAIEPKSKADLEKMGAVSDAPSQGGTVPVFCPN